jgi:hypothetical protein
MSTYKNLIGKDVNFLSTDPDNAQAEGQIWYNSTAGVFKDLIVGQAWSSASSITTPRFNMGSGNTPVTAGLIFGGTGKSVATEEYNGSGWSNGGSMGTGRYQLSGFGTQTAGLGAGGYASPAPGDKALVEEYNGTSWSEVNDLPAARRGAAGFGAQTAGAIAGGVPNLNTTLHYDGTNWTSGGNLPVGQDRTEGAGTGTLTAGFMAAGDNRTSFEYNGSSWTAGPSTSSDHDGGSDTGIQTAAITFGGFLSPGSGQVTSTELYNGTSFTTSPATMANGRYGIGNGGFTGTSAFAAGGDKNPGTISDTEEYNSSINLAVAAAWASGGALPGSGRQGYGVGTGTQTASIIAGGPPTSTQNQFYDGSSWTNLASIPSGVTDSQGFGDSEELLMAGGNTGAPYSALTYVYSRPGNSWTAVASPGNINTARALGAGCGALSTAGIIAGGNTPSYTTATENWNGSAWTTVNALPTATGNGVGSCGTQTAGLIWSGQNPGDPTAEETYEWDGTNWTSGGNRLIGVRAVRGGAGTQTAALTFGGWLDPGGSVSTEGYDGTSWSTRPNMAGAAANNFQTGTQTAALRAGGTDGPGYTAVEEFTGETTALNIRTITTS